MKWTSLAAQFAAIAIAAHAGGAQQASYKRELPDSLVAKTRISETAAAATAQKRVPKGTIQGVELEREDGHLQYSYDIATPGKSGIDEVNVSALTGKIIGVSHESAAQVKKEAAEDAADAKAKAAKPKKP